MLRVLANVRIFLGISMGKKEEKMAPACLSEGYPLDIPKVSMIFLSQPSLRRFSSFFPRILLEISLH